MNDDQTHMTFGKPHHSESHVLHGHGSREPVQVDLQLRLPDNSMHSSIGMPFSGQTTLPMYGVNPPSLR
jgi:hypothetical protein